LAKESAETSDRVRSLRALAMVNIAIWAISIVSLVFVIQRAPSARGLCVVLAGGTGVSISLLTQLMKL